MPHRQNQNLQAVPPTHWLGEDGLDCLITQQGQLLIWKYLKENPRTPKSTMGRKVHGFSRASRLSLLKKLATIDWNLAYPSLFVTLTYPDDVLPESAKDLNKHRFLFVRYMEKYLGKEISVIWRIEWKPRLSGKFVGRFAPHFHLMIFQVAYIPMEQVYEDWQKSVGYFEYIRTEVKRMVNERQAGAYVAKYCGKAEDCSLVNDVHLNNIPTGRQWGVLRPSLLPVHPKRTVRVSADEIRKSRQMANLARPCIMGKDDTFLLLGPTAISVGNEVFREITLTELEE